MRNIIPPELPFFVRISATHWVDGGWDIEQSIVLCKELKALGVDLIDVSSGGATQTRRSLSPKAIRSRLRAASVTKQKSGRAAWA